MDSLGQMKKLSKWAIFENQAADLDRFSKHHFASCLQVIHRCYASRPLSDAAGLNFHRPMSAAELSVRCPDTRWWMIGVLTDHYMRSSSAGCCVTVSCAVPFPGELRLFD